MSEFQGIDFIKYTLNDSEWWKGKHAFILKTYRNLSGDVIIRGSRVSIMFKMQELKPYGFIHTGLFYIKDLNFIEIGGVEFYDLILI